MKTCRGFDHRVQRLNEKQEAKGDYVLYWMQQSQRAEDNHALEYAVLQANRLKRGVVVVFGLTDSYPEANLRHYVFMLEGLKEAQESCLNRGIQMIVRKGSPDDVALKFSRDAVLMVCDRGYLKHQKTWRKNVARKAPCPVIQVESEVVVPVEKVSEKAEYAARTIRPKIHRRLDSYLKKVPMLRVKEKTDHWSNSGLILTDVRTTARELNIDHSVPPVDHLFRGGTARAKLGLNRFLKKKFKLYDVHRNQPQTDEVSYMGMYLHFGQISPLVIAEKIQRTGAGFGQQKAAFIEELIVRRELAINFVNYSPSYASYDGVPLWARKTLKDHQKDKRPYRYSRRKLESAETHDPYWNAAMQEMVHTGYMHNYMRMYWGKKIIEWSPTPESAFKVALGLNNKYFIDGRDPNSYTGVAWLFGLHDRPWGERSIFGKVRYMAASGLERKCDIQGYVQKVEERIKSASTGHG